MLSRWENPTRAIPKRHLFEVDSLDKYMQNEDENENEKELIRLRRFCYFFLRRELPCNLPGGGGGWLSGWFVVQFCLRRELPATRYPHQAQKGG